MGKLWPSLLGLASVGVLSLAANASEIYPPAGPAPGPYAAGIPPRGLILTWTGFYIGAHLGGGWGDLHVTDVDGFAAPAGTRLGLSPDGFFGGGTFGYNFQAGDFLYGFEADFGGMSTGASRLIPAGATTRVGIEDSIYGDVTGRLGYACGPLLYYAKGGF
ncbi:MAG TPA: hypothetical protein VE986_00345, partial [Hyphomicrobiales bacterium]|nr:hypothetical protein [Hyphomicrobiales bacterium]